MRLTRRSLIIGGSATLAAGAGGAALAQRPAAVLEPTPIAVLASPIDAFSVTDPDRRRFGALTFRSGVVLRSDAGGFGGFSGLSRSADGRDIVAMSDNAQWLTARVQTSDGHLSGLSNTVMAPILGTSGNPLRKSRYYDTEGMTIAGGSAYVTVERTHAVLRFDWARAGVRARAQLVPVPEEVRRLPSNSGLEAIGVAPPRSPLAGALVAIAEQARSGMSEPTLGVVVTGSRAGLFQVARSDDYAITDLAFLPNGDMLLLERKFSLFGGLGARLRRLPATAIRPDALADGPVIFESGPSDQVDNMEGLCVHQDAGETVVSLISDDNFRSSFQKTLLLEFALTG